MSKDIEAMKMFKGKINRKTIEIEGDRKVIKKLRKTSNAKNHYIK